MAKKSVEIVLPIYNEEEELEANTKKLHDYLNKNLKGYIWKITIADNASTDRSLAIAQKISKDLRNVHFVHVQEKGRGRAVKKVWNQSKAQIVAYMDIDLSTDLKNFQPLLDSLDSKFDIAIGSRLLPSSRVFKRPLKREILSRGYNIMIKSLFGVHFSDAQCGFKAVKKSVARKLIPHIEDNSWFFDSELLIIGEKSGYQIYQQPVNWVDNPGSTVRVLKTVYGDLQGLWRLFWTKPWNKISK